MSEEKRCENCENYKKKVEKPALHTEVHNNDLIVVYGIDEVGKILSSGDCVILSSLHTMETRERWSAAGWGVDTTPVMWRDGVYSISTRGLLRRLDITNGDIYDFMRCQPQSGCEDTNIQRYKCNNTPKIF